MANDQEPYRPPVEVRRSSSRLKRPWQSLVIAICLWSALSVKVPMAMLLLRPALEDFEVRLPLLTSCWLHPMASVFVLSTTAMILGSAFLVDDPRQRIRLGRIATAIGLIAVVLFLLAVVLPLLQIITALA